MTSDEKKRRRERFLLDRFLERQGIRSKNIDQPEPPNPDFVIDLDGRMVGIELTEIFIRPGKSKKHPQGAEEPLLQEIESITDQIVSQAQGIFFKANDTLVSSKILFSQIKLDRQEGKQISELIANKVRDMASERVDKWSAATDDGSQLLIEAVSRIFIHRVPEKRFAHWTVMRPGIVANLTLKHLQDRIDHKAQKLKDYNKNKEIEEIWLLMVADRTRPSQMLQRSSDLPLESLWSPFAKTLYYCYPTDEPVVELRPVER
jgi:hypothetical protein